jgi:hypothetical protein
MIQLLSGPYIVVISERTLACKLFDHFIWRITAADIFPCSNHQKTLSDQQRRDEEQFVALLKSFLQSEWLYYSSTWDLTRNLQAQVHRQQPLMASPVNLKFVVNRFIAMPFLEILTTRTDTHLEDFMIFCIEGCLIGQIVGVVRF